MGFWITVKRERFAQIRALQGRHPLLVDLCKIDLFLL